MTVPPADLADSFAAVARRLRRSQAAVLEPLGLTPHLGRALRVVVADGPLRLGELAERLRVAPRSVTDVVDALEETGHVAREPDPSDRRAVVVRATSVGGRLALAVDRSRRQAAGELFGRLSPTDRDDLERVLARLLED